MYKNLHNKTKKEIKIFLFLISNHNYFEMEQIKLITSEKKYRKHTPYLQKMGYLLI